MKTLTYFFLIFPIYLMAQEPKNSEKFWSELSAHWGKAYEGKILEGAVPGDGFYGEKLVMHVRSCSENEIRISFFVGENKSRTWVLRLSENKIINLKHDHRHLDGTEEELTQYGGISSNHGLADLQMFPADPYTSQILPAASSNIWWFTINESTFTYNLRRIGSDRLFSVSFDFSKPIPTPGPPWGTLE
ncbi:hypothetical protein EI546_04880 [Aequorivita sp. H23M31]|uniref:Secreted protein n=1 Tax=Aequorivita ciconiae TaxID=2494375 RepID=A0A410G1G1_9FLAO|nr:hypothetical protein [Aequorivita sp. H23M31]QAA81102.1 hypothetical protein EI546_04880 [Aequorivita sp. H23M31]